MTKYLYVVLRDMVTEVSHLHNMNVLHRDLKPSNVLMTMDPTLCAKLADMGISKKFPPDRSSLRSNISGQ